MKNGKRMGIHTYGCKGHSVPFWFTMKEIMDLLPIDTAAIVRMFWLVRYVPIMVARTDTRHLMRLCPDTDFVERRFYSRRLSTLSGGGGSLFGKKLINILLNEFLYIVKTKIHVNMLDNDML